MHSLLKSFEQFIYPQYCNYCETPLSEVELLFCSKCRVNDIQFSKLENWVRQLKTHENLDYAHSFYWYGDVIQAYIHHLKYSSWNTFYLDSLIMPSGNQNCPKKQPKRY